jgi:prepilin-type N-terminal cleavage/methylation domain-containing protein
MSQAIVKLETIRKPGQRGFSLLELLVVLVILGVVLGVVMGGVQSIKTNTTQADNVDLTQEARQFMDQVVQDLHYTGFPPVGMFNPATQLLMAPGGCLSVAPQTCYAAGLVSISNNAIQYEGDVDGTGVSEIFVQLSPAGGPCPCALRRGQVSKFQFVNAGAVPAYYTEVDGVMTLNVFSAYDFAGNAIPLPCTPVGAAPAICADAVTPITDIKNVGLLLNVQSKTPDPTTKAFTAVTVSTEAKISN